MADSLYNIRLLREFSNEHLNKCFYLTLEDMLYAPLVLKVNRHQTCPLSQLPLRRSLLCLGCCVFCFSQTLWFLSLSCSGGLRTSNQILSSPEMFTS